MQACFPSPESGDGPVSWLALAKAGKKQVYSFLSRSIVLQRKRKLESRGVHREHARGGPSRELALARAIADAGAVLAPIVPWTTAALTPALLLGVEARAFIPFAAFCWLQPLIELLFLRRGSFARTKNTPNPDRR